MKMYIHYTYTGMYESMHAQGFR